MKTEKNGTKNYVENICHLLYYFVFLLQINLEFRSNNYNKHVNYILTFKKSFQNLLKHLARYYIMHDFLSSYFGYNHTSQLLLMTSVRNYATSFSQNYCKKQLLFIMCIVWTQNC